MKLRTTLLLCAAALLASLPSNAADDSLAELLSCADQAVASAAAEPQATPPLFALPPLPTCASCSTAACRGARVGAFCNSGTPLQGRCLDTSVCPADGKWTCYCGTGPF